MPAYRNNNQNPKPVRINFEVCSTQYITLTQPIKKACHLVWKVSIDFPVHQIPVDVSFNGLDDIINIFLFRIMTYFICQQL